MDPEGKSSLLDEVNKTIEDPVSMEIMDKAVTVIPCGHNFNEDTILQCLKKNKLCPLCRQEIQLHVPNYTIRNLATAALQNQGQVFDKIEEKVNEVPEEAKRLFENGKHLADSGRFGEAANYLLNSLQLHPDYEKAQMYLDFVLKKSSEEQKAKDDPGNDREELTKSLLSLVEDPQVNQNEHLLKSIQGMIEEAINQNQVELTELQKNISKWLKQLFVNNKLSNFVAEKIIKIVRERDGSTNSQISTPKTTEQIDIRDKLSELYAKPKPLSSLLVQGLIVPKPVLIPCPIPQPNSIPMTPPPPSSIPKPPSPPSSIPKPPSPPDISKEIKRRLIHSMAPNIPQHLQDSNRASLAFNSNSPNSPNRSNLRLNHFPSPKLPVRTASTIPNPPPIRPTSLIVRSNPPSTRSNLPSTRSNPQLEGLPERGRGSFGN